MIAFLLVGCASPGLTPSSPPTATSTLAAAPAAPATPIAVVATPALTLPVLSASPTAQAPSGDLLVFRNPDPWEPYGYAWVVAADGTSLRTLGAAVEASWSADGRRVRLVAPGPDCVPSLVTEAPDGSGRVVLSHGFRSLDSAFTWSPDGRQVAFLRFRDGPPPTMCGSQGGTYRPLVMDLWVMQADASGARVLVSDFPLSGLRSFVWSHDSSRIAFLTQPDASGSPSAVSVTFVRVADGRRMHSTAGVLAASANGLTWSPDGTRLAFSFVPPVSGSSAHLAVMNTNGTGLRDLAAHVVFAGVAWSPDATLLAAETEVAGGSGAGSDIVLVRADGSASRDLGLGDVGGYPFGPSSWSPDGRWLAYVSEVSDASGQHPGPVLEISADGSTRHEVPGTGMTGTTDFAEWVAWQPGR